MSNMTVIRSWMIQSFKWFSSVAVTHLLNELIVYMIQFNRSDSLITSDFLPPTGEFNFTFKVYFRV